MVQNTSSVCGIYLCDSVIIYMYVLQIVWDKEKGKWVDLDAGSEVS